MWNDPEVVAAAEDEHLADLAGAAAVIAGAVTAFLLSQVRRVTENFAEYGVPERVWEGFHDATEIATLRTKLRPAFERVIEAQVVKDVAALPGASTKYPKRKPLEAAVAYQRRWARFGRKLPDGLKNAIAGQAESLLAESYWGDVALRQLEVAEREFAASLKEVTNRQQAANRAAQRIKQDVRRRTKSISETEANGAVNSGRAVAADVRGVLGLDDTKTWMTMRDERVRKTHAALHGVTIARSALFSVGGHLAPHPGFWELPIQERIRCRCFIWLSAGAETFDYPLAEDLRISVP